MPYIQEQRPRVTIIPKARINLLQDKYLIDYFVTGWTEPQHTLKSHIAQEPLENGAMVTDHVVAMPVEVEMKGMVSDIKDGGDAPAQAWQKIRELHYNKAIMDIATEWGYYKDMVIKNAETQQVHRGMEFTIQFQQILRVGIQVEEIVNPTIPTVTETTSTVVLRSAGNDTVVPDSVSNTFGPSGQDVSQDTLTRNWGISFTDNTDLEGGEIEP